MERTIVFYDDDCGFCRWSCEQLRRWDKRHRLSFEPIDSPEGDRALGAIDRTNRAASFHVRAGSEVTSGGRAVPTLLRQLPGGRPFAAMSSALPNVTERAYRLVSRHRQELGRLVGQKACAVDPSRQR